MKRKMRSIVAILCLVAAVAVTIGAAGKKYACTLHGLTFESGAEFSAPQKAGLDALLAVHPRKAKPGKEKMGIMAVLYSRETQKSMGMKDAGLLDYTRSVFLGVVKAGKPIERVFAGKKVRGDAAEKKIPVPMTVETYVLTLANGSRVGIAFNYIPQFKAEAEKIIAEIAASIRE